jgi:hypothetical protein
MTVDGTDIRIPERGRDFRSHKTKKSAFRYEVACSILGPYICCISGPYPAGLWDDLGIFRDCLLTYLEDFERVETDDGYIGEAPLYVSCPGMIGFEEEREKMTKRATKRQETINKRLKQWKILDVLFCHVLLDHRNVFVAIACITQVAMLNGEPLFDCSEYEY